MIETHMLIEEEIKKNPVYSDLVIIMDQKKKVNGKNVYSFHNFATGDNYNTFNEIPVTKDKRYLVILKYIKISDIDDEAYAKHTDNMSLASGNCSTRHYCDFNTVTIENKKYLILYGITINTTTVKEQNEIRIPVINECCYVDENKELYNFYGERCTAVNNPDKNNASIINRLLRKQILCETYLEYNQRKFTKAVKEMGWLVYSTSGLTYNLMEHFWQLGYLLTYKEPLIRNTKSQAQIERFLNMPFKKYVYNKSDCNNIEDSNSSNNYLDIEAIEGDTSVSCIRVYEHKDDYTKEIIRVYIENGKLYACKKTNTGKWLAKSLKKECINAYIRNADVNVINKLPFKYIFKAARKYKGERGGWLFVEMLKNPDIEKLLSYNQINEYINEHLHFQTYSISVPFNTAFENEIGIINKGSSANAILGLNNEQLSYVHELNGVINYRKEELEKEYDKQHTKNNLFITSKYTAYRYIGPVKRIVGSTDIRSMDINSFKTIINYLAEIDMYWCEYVPFYKQVLKSNFYNPSIPFPELDREKFGIKIDLIIREYKGKPLLTKATKEMINNNYKNYYHDSKAAILIKNTPDIRLIEKMLTGYCLLTSVNSLIAAIKNRMFEILYDNCYLQNDFSNYIYASNYISDYYPVINMAYLIMQESGTKQDIKISNIKDIKILHDDIYPVYNYYMQEIYKKTHKKEMEEAINKWDKLKNVWNKYTYSDKEYTVIYPETPADLSVEGSALAHCVGGYVNKVAAHQTNIFFIRKNTALDKPLFTVELSNKGVIEQIHGYGNSNIIDTKVKECEPHINQFVKDWITARNLTTSDYCKVR